MPDEINEYGGPWLQAAVFCEKILQERDGVMSLIRIVDRFTITASGPDAPERMPKANLQFHGALMFKSGFARGSFTASLAIRTPSGRVMQEASLPMLLEGHDRGVQLNFNMNLVLEEDGLYWVDVSVGNRLMTRMPLRVVYQRIQGAQRPPQP